MKLTVVLGEDIGKTLDLSNVEIQVTYERRRHARRQKKEARVHGQRKEQRRRYHLTMFAKVVFHED